MGLDTYPSRLREQIVLTPADEAAFAAVDLPLCEWAARGSFRGKVYLDVSTGSPASNLGEEWIPPEEVARKPKFTFPHMGLPKTGLIKPDWYEQDMR